MIRVIIESPFRAFDLPTQEKYLHYARTALFHSLLLGEAPIASHLLHTQVLNDDDIFERELGIKAGHAWISQANLMAIYTDLGITSGMRAGIKCAERFNIPIVYRYLEDNPTSGDSK